MLRDFWHTPTMEGYPLSNKFLYCFIEIGTYLRLGRLEYLVIEIKDQKGLQTLK